MKAVGKACTNRSRKPTLRLSISLLFILRTARRLPDFFEVLRLDNARRRNAPTTLITCLTNASTECYPRSILTGLESQLPKLLKQLRAEAASKNSPNRLRQLRQYQTAPIPRRRGC